MSSDRRKHLLLYGIKNCDSCRKAQGWLRSHQADFTFLDVREEGLPEARMKGWLESDQGSKLLNRRSTTWRNLSEAERSAAEKDPLPLLLANPTLVKRPLVTAGGELLAVGFSPAVFEKLI
jgi:Spx/MgsR family transcriptional regulator